MAYMKSVKNHVARSKLIPGIKNSLILQYVNDSEFLIQQYHDRLELYTQLQNEFPEDVLIIDSLDSNTWKLLCDFLDTEYKYEKKEFPKLNKTKKWII